MPQFSFVETASFEKNISSFYNEVSSSQKHCATTIKKRIDNLPLDNEDRQATLNELFAHFTNPAPEDNTPAPTAPAPTLPPLPAAARWFLESVEIEGFRGINNEGTPLVLKFKTNGISSISAPNGVGKSSIYDALCFAITGKIPKLDRLLASENSKNYYINKFHTAQKGTVILNLQTDAIPPVPIKIICSRDANGTRQVSSPTVADPQSILETLDREFVLLDGQTFQKFIDDKALDRGRSFAGLLGLSRYSTTRQWLQAVSNTRAFNVHFDTATVEARKLALERKIAATKSSLIADHNQLTKQEYVEGTKISEMKRACAKALEGIPILRVICENKDFMDINFDDCMQATINAEAGPERQKLIELLRQVQTWTSANKNTPDDEAMARLAEIAKNRDAAILLTAGEPLAKLFKQTEAIMASDWPNANICPACDEQADHSILDHVRGKIAQYEAVQAATLVAQEEWQAQGWSDLEPLEKLLSGKNTALLIKTRKALGESGALTFVQVAELADYIRTLRSQAIAEIEAINTERIQLESALPPSLVAVTTAIEIAKRMRLNWPILDQDKVDLKKEKATQLAHKSLKDFLDKASKTFSEAESQIANLRLSRVEPLAQQMFASIMYSPITPAFKKVAGSEELAIHLKDFRGLQNMSAQALLSESYRNAFAISVYLAAASLYGGAPRFIVLDDITSSLDAGHQHHLIEVIRNQFSLPVQIDGPQVVMLSHDTLLEKLFNKHSGSANWSHQRLEGTPHTAVLPQSGAANKVKDAANDLLNQGRVEEASLRIRPYLEYTLNQIIDNCRIPVPIDLAFGDEKRTAGEFLAAIQAAVSLEERAGTLILSTVQRSNLQINSATIIANFVSHWSSGQTQPFSAASLQGVMVAIDNFKNCFTHTPPSGPVKFYRTLHSK